MNNFKVVGLGPGNLDYLTVIGKKVIEKAEVVIGGKRQLEDVRSLNKGAIFKELKKLDEILEFLNKNQKKNIVFVVSGDSGYYSLLNFLKRKTDYEFDVFPGISSYQYFFAKLQMCWENFKLLSVHGREIDIYKELLESKNGITLLTDDKNNPIKICEELISKGVKGVEVFIGEDLSYKNECITSFKIEDYKNYIKNYEMNVVILKKE